MDTFRIGINFSGFESPTIPDPDDFVKGMGWGALYNGVGISGGGDAELIQFSNYSDMVNHANNNLTTPFRYEYTGDDIVIQAQTPFEGLRNKTFTGRGQTLTEQWLYFNNQCENIIWENFKHYGSWQSGERDIIQIRDRCVGIWVRHCEIDAGHMTGVYTNDGSLDITIGSDLCIVSDNILKNGDKTCLLGANDTEPLDIGKLRVSYFRNHFKNNIQRLIRGRRGKPDVVNNYYEYDPVYHPTDEPFWEDTSPKAMQIGFEVQAWVRGCYGEGGRSAIVWATTDRLSSGCVSENNIWVNFEKTETLGSLNPDNVLWSPYTQSGYSNPTLLSPTVVKSYVLANAGVKVIV
jgi:pectate lyase